MKSKKVFPPESSEAPAVVLNLSRPEDLQLETQGVQLAIAQRAYELFEVRGREHGHDWEDWFRAESEFLRPVSVSMSESEDAISVRANVLGFEQNEIRVSVEPFKITIFGKKETSATETEGGKIEYIDWSPDQILKIIDLTTEVMPEGSVIELQGGMVKFELPKATKHEIETSTKAA